MMATIFSMKTFEYEMITDERERKTIKAFAKKCTADLNWATLILRWRR